jgi:type I restriction enzyme, S subunit
MSGYPKKPLAGVLTRIQESVEINPAEIYKQVTVRLFHKGVVLRGEQPGSSIRTTRQWGLRAGQFLLSRIDARNGAIGLVPAELDGAIVTNDFWAFGVDEKIAEPRFLDAYFGTSEFVEACKSASEGTTNRVRLQPDGFLRIEVPCPPLPEQRRIVARIEELSAKIEEARGLRGISHEQADSLMASEEMRLWPIESLSDAPTLEGVTTHLARGRQSAQGHSDHLLIKTQHVQMGRYVPTKMTLAPHVANKVDTESLVRPGDVLIACSAAGCLGRVAFYSDGNGHSVSTDTHVAIARPNKDRVLPEYLYTYLRGAQGQIQLRSREKGDWTREKIGFRLIELNVADMRRIPIPLPPLPEQRRIVAYLNDLQTKVDAVKKLQQETAEELNALMPSILSRAFSARF